MALTVGGRLGPYEILGLIGAGGKGEVYRARDTRLQRDVAFKVLPAGLAADTGHLQRFAVYEITPALGRCARDVAAGSFQMY